MVQQEICYYVSIPKGRKWKIRMLSLLIDGMLWKKYSFSSPAPPQVFQIDVESDENEE